MDRNKQIVVLVAVLLAIIAVSVVLLWLLPSRSHPAAAPAPDASVTAAEFNVRVLQRAEYLQLNTQPVKDGSLPVQPPAPVGKANPFL